MFCNGFMIGFLFLVCTVEYSFVDQQESSNNVTAAVGSDVRLNCLVPGSKVYWMKYDGGSSPTINTPMKGIHNEYRERFSIANGSDADLVIRNVSLNDTGTYRCINEDNDDSQYLLIVLGTVEDLTTDALQKRPTTMEATVEDLTTDALQKRPTTREATVEDLTTDAPQKRPTTTEATSTEKTANENLSTIIIAVFTPVVLIFVLGFIGLCLWCNRRSNRIKRRRNQNLQDENFPLLPGKWKSSESIDLKIVRGIASIKGKIYIIFQDASFIRVIGNTEDFVKEDDICIKATVEPWSLDASECDDWLYISDRSKKCIWRVNVIGSEKGLTKKICELNNPYKFSVASDGRLVIPVYPNSFQVRNSGGCSIEGTLELHKNIVEPYCVLKTSRGTFFVAHGHEKSQRHGVCEVRPTTQNQCSVVWSFPKDESDKIENVDQSAMDECGRIFVMDQNNGRIILLDKDGQKIHEFKTEKFPYRMCYDLENKQLVVGHYGAVAVYKWKDGEGRGASTEECELLLHSMSTCGRLPHSENAVRSFTSVIDENLQERKTDMDIGDLVVTGIAELHGILNVVFSQNNFIRVYRAITPFEKESDQVVERLKDPFFIASCTINTCLYITDKERQKVLKVDAYYTETEWEINLEEPYRLSVNSKGHILIPRWSSQSLEIYDSSGINLKYIALPSDIGLIEPLHAVELSEGLFAVSHGDKRSPHHRVCKITCEPESSTSELISTFGDERGGYKDEGQLNRPRSLAKDDNGRVIIADAGNRRIVILDADWKTFVSVKTTITPGRICYSKESKEIFIGNFGTIITVAARYSATEL